MWFGIVSLFPEEVTHALDFGVIGRAIRAGTVQIQSFNPRNHATDRHGTVDDSPYGGGPGMVMKAEPLLAAVDEARRAAQQADCASPVVVLLSAQGRTFDQPLAAEFASIEGLILVCGRYEGVDQRFVERAVDIELSVGDFVVSGGEIPALLVVDAVSRLIGGTLGNPDSLLSESHLDGLLEYPQYTRPETLAQDDGVLTVPNKLLSGDHKAIARHQRQAQLLKTYERRPARLLDSGVLANPQDRALLKEALSSGDHGDGHQ